MKTFLARGLTASGIAVALVSLAACSNAATGDISDDERASVAVGAMVDGMSSLIPSDLQDSICDSLTRLYDPDDVVASPLYSSNSEEAKALRELLATVGQSGGDAAGITFDDELQKIVLGRLGVSEFCARR